MVRENLHAVKRVAFLHWLVSHRVRCEAPSTKLVDFDCFVSLYLGGTLQLGSLDFYVLADLDFSH